MAMKPPKGTPAATPRMAEVAKRAGVSVSTVSRALAGSPRIPKETADRIRLASAELSYIPNSAARSLRTSQSRTVIVVVPDISNTYFAMLLRGIEEEALANGYSVLVGNAANDPAREAVYAQHVIARRADGLILVNGRLPDFGANAPADLPPIVVVSERIAGAALPFVGIDDIVASRNAVDHLTALGHRSIACIAGHERSPFTRDRVAGYREALARHGIAYDPALLAYGDFSIPSGSAAAARLLPLRPSAIFACNDEMAIGAVLAIKAAGLSVPNDVSVVGFDDIPFATSYDPPLTTIRQPFMAIGHHAMSLLIARLDGGKARRETLLPTELVVRSSTRRPS